MAYRLLVIEEGSTESSVRRFLTPDSGFQCETETWESFQPASVRGCAAELILPVALADTPQIIDSLERLREQAITQATLAILPSEPSDALLQTACGAADDFMLSPIRESELRQRVGRMLGVPRPDVEAVRERLVAEIGLAQLIGNAPVFTRLVEQLPAIARSDAPVLITGETGTGKELFARATHFLGKRRHFPFIAVDCAALPEHLFENEIFGHARGAFTDAHRDQKGLIGMAEGGTLFLDEIDSLSLAAQAKLLRFLQERSFRRLGADHFEHADVNVIAATNRDLESCVRDKQFRSDLYFRLNVLRVCLPPLRERSGDVALLARHFLEALNKNCGPIRKSLAASALRTLIVHDWPGNVRELANVVQRAALTSQGAQILPCHISLSDRPGGLGRAPASFHRARAAAVEAFERHFVEELLRKHHGNVTRAAIEAQKDRRAFGRLVKKYKIDRDEP
jgi:two-component system response regulator GlrR